MQVITPSSYASMGTELEKLSVAERHDEASKLFHGVSKRGQSLLVTLRQPNQHSLLTVFNAIKFRVLPEVKGLEI